MQLIKHQALSQSSEGRRGMSSSEASSNGSLPRQNHSNHKSSAFAQFRKSINKDAVEGSPSGVGQGFNLNLRRKDRRKLFGVETSNDDGQEHYGEDSTAMQEYSIGGSNMFPKAKHDQKGKLTTHYSLHYKRSSQASNK